MNEKLIFEKPKKRADKVATDLIRVHADAADIVADIAGQIRRSKGWVASEMIRFAARHVEMITSEQSNSISANSGYRPVTLTGEPARYHGEDGSSIDAIEVDGVVYIRHVYE